MQNPQMARQGSPPEEFLTVSDAADILGLSAEMVRVLHRKGQLPAQRTPRGYRLFLRGDVERLARAREGKGGR